MSLTCIHTDPKTGVKTVVKPCVEPRRDYHSSRSERRGNLRWSMDTDLRMSYLSASRAEAMLTISF